jgi:5-methylcytosine-specific restriction endonuclease McrA
MTTMFVSAIVAAACTLMAHGALPDAHCTPGAVQSTNATAICMPGWASRHRHVTSSTRAQVSRRYGLTGNHPFPQWEVDHRVPLELGGSNTITNLWPEHRPQTKDQLENKLHDQVCAGQIKLVRAQRIFERDWRAYQ